MLCNRRTGEEVLRWSRLLVEEGVYRRAMLRIGNAVELQLLSEEPRLLQSSAEPRKQALLMDTIRNACVRVLWAPADASAQARHLRSDFVFCFFATADGPRFRVCAMG